MAEVEAEETQAIEVAGVVAGVVHMDRSNRTNPRRRIFLTSPNTWTSKCLSSLMVVEKVSARVLEMQNTTAHQRLSYWNVKGL